MASARTICPQCGGPHVVDLLDWLYSSRVDFFRCGDCQCWWQLPKGADGPAARAVLSDPDYSPK